MKLSRDPKVLLGVTVLTAVIALSLLTAALLGANASRDRAAEAISALQDQFISLKREVDDLRRQLALSAERGAKRSDTLGLVVLPKPV